MSNMNIQSVLSQMRVMEAQAKSPVGTDALPVNQLQGTAKTEFSDVLANSINSVNETMKASKKMAAAFEKGDSNISMAELMITMEKSSVSMQAMTQVRNKLLSAYKEIMNMPV